MLTRGHEGRSKYELERLATLLALLHWWTDRLRATAAAALTELRRSPEWPLLIAGKLLLASFAFHLIGFRLARAGILFGPTEWEGRTGFRKPMLFGVSNAMVFAALARVLRLQRLVPRGPAAHAAAWATLLEVGVITLQAWRDEESHFNTSTPLDATLYAIKLGGVSVLGATCLAVTAGCVLRPSGAAEGERISASELAAARYGMLLLSTAVLVGFTHVGYVHMQKLASAPEATPGAWPQGPAAVATERECRRATAGAHGAPCYEVRGEALWKVRRSGS